MAIYTSTFNGNPVDPAYPSYNLIELNSDITLQWATAFQDTDYAVSGIMNVNPSISGYTITLPNATLVSPGKAFIITNTSSNPLINFSLLKSDSSVLIPTISNVEGYFVYVQDNTSPDGEWGIIPFTGSDALTYVAAVSLTAGLTIGGSPIEDAGTFVFSIDLLTLWNNIANNSLNASKLLDGSIATAKLADNSVTANKLAAGAVTSTRIANSAVTTDKIANDAVETDKIDNGAVTTAKIADGAVTTAEMADGAVTTAKIADGAVTANKLAAGAVDEFALADNAVTTDKIADFAVTNSKLAGNSVTSNKIQVGSITSPLMAANAVGTAALQDSAVTTAKIADGAVTRDKLAVDLGTGFCWGLARVGSSGIFEGTPVNIISVTRISLGFYTVVVADLPAVDNKLVIQLTPFSGFSYPIGISFNWSIPDKSFTVATFATSTGALSDFSFCVSIFLIN